MKSLNLSLKARCPQCSSARERKKRRLDREHENIEEAVTEEENEEVAVSEEDELSDGKGDGVRKRKKSGENHTHCHCKLFLVSDGLGDYMAGGNPIADLMLTRSMKELLLKWTRLSCCRKGSKINLSTSRI